MIASSAVRAHHAAQAYPDARGQGLDDATATDRALAVIADGPTLAAEVTQSAKAATRRRSGSIALWWPDAVRDLRYAFRLLRTSPAFTAVAVITIALGIGGTASIFAVVNAVLLKPLPYASPDDLVFVGERSSLGEPNNVGYATFVDWQARSRSYAGMGLIRSFQPAVVLDGNTERVTGMRVSANYFRLLGVSPALGRDFSDADDAPARANILMLSDGFWRRAFHADRSVVGRTVSVSGTPFTVVGVMPASFEELTSERFYQRAEIWAPLGYDTTLPQACRGCQHLKALARLKVGVSLEAAQVIAGQDGAMILAGLALGVVTAVGAARLLSAASLPGLFGVSALDPLSFIGAVTFLALTAVAAESIPIARALKVDPAVALRQP